MTNPALAPLAWPQLEAFLLTLVRVSGIFLITPFYSGPAIPMRLKAGLSVAAAACLSPLAGGRAPAPGLSTLPALALAVLGELALGFAMGLAAAVVLGAIQTAGQLMAQDIGLTIANVIDPLSNLQSSVLGQLKVSLALFIFVGLDLHHGVLRLLGESLEAVPPGSAGTRLLGAGAGGLGDLAIREGSLLFEAAVRLGLPVAVVLLLVTVAMGFLARSVPEMNVFVIGFGLRALVGLWVLVLALPLLARAFQSLFEWAAGESREALRALGN